MPDMPVQVPVDDPNADTEWNDILRKHKIIPEKPPSPTPMIEAALEEVQRLAHENRLEGKELDELEELEDEEDEEFLEFYRQKRLQEMNALASKARHGKVYPIAKPDYSREITEASKEFPVLLHLSSQSHGNVESKLLSELFRQAAHKFPEIKFCEIVGNMCIENYPEKNCPTILVYKDGDLAKNLIRLGEMKGVDTRLPDFEKWMLQQGVLKEGDMRLRNREEEEERKEIRSAMGIKSASNNKARVDDDEDSDWD
ncbi:phosducin [Sphaerosporella brunnea]|uniref:Phosducin n=1 Tax=Sphaerosporella brunnea TaxID=1250544 RepID=A0A5J5EIX2_9PEZI|nr:phosducin [Sphaerosporella brunnea]KAA8895037.1 phosducin [Sphaerosporella brunnea]